ncbi:DNA polymerase III subunit gamma and tau [Micromonospora zingiberis]|uniref:DNA polymerase III subunit gamma/tau n=1 Tax=Micromonospora zingiberis TaxID=2053011 RepID=A0A4R0GQM5_9ACTN|nr:DNA polymerase III subunit gamma and tau [Micromonospora zingiberis]TCB98883.1 DNA polymerase III subunit gamma and tau [Micromonospora zingiberis]
MALALYRKYRPRTFAEVIGQEHVTEPLSQALRSGRLNHAYLFSGPRGCGKTSSARILARSLNCEHGPTPEPCGVCASCRSLSSDGAGSIDVIEIDAASHGGVDDARELREKAFFAPASSRFKIYVIDEAHMVSSAGFNALLKLVEEPPEYVKFIFATTEPEKVLGTIKSRTHHYPFRLIPPKVLRPYLEQLTQAEGVQVEPAVFPLVVRAGGGSARDSLSVLDQLIAGAGPDGVTYARAAALLGVTDAALIDEMCDALAAGDGAAAYATVDRVAEAGHDPRRFASDLLERLRDLIVLQQVPDAVTKGLIDGPDDQIERMTAQAQRLGPATLSRCADLVHDGLVEMRGTTAPRLLLELICARMLLPGVDDSAGGLLQRLERMERRLTLAGTDAPPATADSAPSTAAPAVRTQPPAPPAAVAAPQAATAGEPAAPGAPTGVAAARAAAAGAGTREPAAGNAGALGTAAGNAGALGAAAGNGGARSAGTANGGGQGAAGATGAGSGTAGAPAAGPTGAETARRPVPPSAVMPDPATPEPPRPGAAKPGVLDAAAVRRVWPEVVGKVNRSHKKIAALMRDAVVRDLDGDTLVLTVKSAVLARMMSDHAQVLTDALYEELGGRWQIRCEVAGERGGVSPGNQRATPSPAPAPSRPTPDTPPNGTMTGSGGRPHGAADAVARSDGPSGSGRSAGPSGAGRGAAGRSGAASSAGDTASADEDEGWPEPARPGGSAPTSTTAEAGDAEDGWPEAARPGGAPAGRDTSPNLGASGAASPTAAATRAAGAQPANGAPVVASNGPQAGPTMPAPPLPGATNGGNGSTRSNGANGSNGNGSAGGAGRAPVSSAIAAARAAAAGRGARTAQATRQTADVEFAGEPPYDPDFDGPLRGGAGGSGGQPAGTVAYEGFDPGDEPLDEIIDEKTARESSEEQAVRLLREAFAGTEKIAESDHR